MGTSYALAENIVLPDEGLAVTVLTNQDAASAAAQIGDRVRDALLEQTTPRDEQRTALARKVFEELRQGRIDRSLFTANANACFSEQAQRNYADGLRPLGPGPGPDLIASSTWIVTT